MLVVLSGLNSAHAGSALDAIAISLAFEQQIDVVLLTAASDTAENIEKLRSISALGLKKIHLFEPSDANHALEHLKLPVAPIGPKEFRRLCASHNMTVSF